MKDATWSALTPKQQHALLLAMNVRSAMEDFHGDNLTDLQIMQLNQIIRQATSWSGYFSLPSTCFCHFCSMTSAPLVIKFSTAPNTNQPGLFAALDCLDRNH
jgi:hypothetical protein